MKRFMLNFAAIILLLGVMRVTAANAAVVKISIINFTYVPDKVTVNVGDTVVWTATADHHTVTADNGAFDSSNGTGQTLPLNGTFSHTFATAGSFPYHCQIHGAPGGIGMSGVITVSSGSTASSPAITGLSATSGSVGTLLTITGKNFTGTTAVRFGGINAGFSLLSPTQIITAVPTGATTGAISVVTPGGTASSAVFRVTTSSAPTITGFSPAGGVVGSTVTLTGTNLSGATVRIGSTHVSIASNTATGITFIVPAGAATGPLSVTTATGTVTGNVFTVAPTITSVTPATGSSGAVITIKGANFTGATAVRFNGVGAVFVVNAPTQITAVVPTGATNGSITVTTLAGIATSPTAFKVH